MISQPNVADLRSDPVSRGSLRVQLTARLVAAIFARDFRSGQRLVVQNLAKAYEVSPTPLRESLVELASLGLVDLLPNRERHCAAVRSAGGKRDQSSSPGDGERGRVAVPAVEFRRLSSRDLKMS